LCHLARETGPYDEIVARPRFDGAPESIRPFSSEVIIMSRSHLIPRVVAFAHGAALLAALSAAAATVAWARPSSEEPAAAPNPEMTAPKDGAAAGEGAGAIPTASERRAELTPRMREILDAWDAHVLAVEALERQLCESTDDAAAIEIERQIENARRQVEIDILQIQARYARNEGRLADAAEIDAAIAVMTAPAPRGEPIERPAPGPEPR